MTTPRGDNAGMSYGNENVTVRAPYMPFDFSSIHGDNQKAQMGWVDATQMGLDVIGMTEIPFVSQGAELFSAGISFVRGDTFGGLLGLGSMVPIIGKTFEATKIARYAAKRGRAFFSGAGTEAKAIEQGFQTLGQQTRAGQNLQNLITSKNIPWKGPGNAEYMWK